MWVYLERLLLFLDKVFDGFIAFVDGVFDGFVVCFGGFCFGQRWVC